MSFIPQGVVYFHLSERDKLTEKMDNMGLTNVGSLTEGGKGRRKELQRCVKNRKVVILLYMRKKGYARSTKLAYAFCFLMMHNCSKCRLEDWNVVGVEEVGLKWTCRKAGVEIEMEYGLHRLWMSKGIDCTF